MNVHLFVVSGLLSVAGLLLQPSSAHPAGVGPSLKRYKRSSDCSEIPLLGGTVQEWKHAPEGLKLASQLVAQRSKWSCFVQVVRDGGKVGGGGVVNVCEGWREGEGTENDVVLVEDSSAKVQYILFSVPPSLSHSHTLWFKCLDSPPQCFTLLPQGWSKARVRRNAQGAHSSAHSARVEGAWGGRWVAGVCVGVAGLIGILASLAMCAHSSQDYDTDVPITRTSEVASTDEPISEPISEPTAVKSESLMNLLNGSISQDGDQPQLTISVDSSEGSKPLSSQQSGSLDPLIQSGNGAEEVHRKDASLPNNPMPMLEVADSPEQGKTSQVGAVIEDNEGGYASVTKQHSERGEYDYVDNKVGSAGQSAEDESGYAYATVRGGGGAVGEGPVRGAEPGHGRGGASDQESRERGSGLPPYGKVTRHAVPVSKRGSYSEVLTASPMLPPGRPRAVTEPIDPSLTDARKSDSVMRDNRALTESAAHLPLPQVPNVEVNDEMYDSIPEEMRETAAKSDGENGVNTARESVPVRDSLYESVEVEGEGEPNQEGGEDTYESVPEDIRQTAPAPSSPMTITPTSPHPPPPRSPTIFRVISEAQAAPPSPSRSARDVDEDDRKKKGKDHGPAKDHGKGEQKKHKALSKAKSDTGTESRGRSLSSFFARKKGGSNVPQSPKHTREKDQHEPLPRIPTEGSVSSPLHLLPPSPPPIPAPPPPEDDEEEDYPPDSAYDMIDVINPRGAAMLRGNDMTPKEKSASLPASMRSAGASIFHHVDHGPLPEVPEESAGGLVARQRVKEDMDPEYDTVVLDQVQNEPSYDSVEIIREVDAMPKLEPAQPAGGEEGEQEREQAPANKYAKVSSHAAVENALSPDLTACSPEHDDLGYAIIPAHLKMRKRAKSDAMKLKQEQVNLENLRSKSVDDPGYDKITPSSQGAVEGLDNLLSPSPPMEPEYESVTDALRNVGETTDAVVVETPYSTVDMAAKRRSQMLRQQSGSGGCALDSNSADDILRDVSPNPPPLPEQGDLGDLAEFEQPPVPLQAETSLQLITSHELRPPGADNNPYSQIDVLVDPPYASVKKKSDPNNESTKELAKEEGEEDDEENPYATVDGDCGEIRVVTSEDRPYAKIKKGKVVKDEDESTIAGSEHPTEGVITTAAPESHLNGDHVGHGAEGEQEGEDTYDRLDHGLGNLSTCSGDNIVSPDGAGEYSTLTVDFSTSPELVVTTNSDVVRQTEETTINFTD